MGNEKIEKFEGILAADPVRSSWGSVYVDIEPKKGVAVDRTVVLRIEGEEVYAEFLYDNVPAEGIVLEGVDADIAMEYLKRGSFISGEGKRSLGHYVNDEGNPDISVSIFATSVNFREREKAQEIVEFGVSEEKLRQYAMEDRQEREM